MPACRSCKVSGVNCIYDLQSDRRKPFTKVRLGVVSADCAMTPTGRVRQDVVVALQSRLDALKEELAHVRLHGCLHGLPPASPPVEGDSTPLRSGVPALASTHAPPSTAAGILVPPPTKFPLSPRPTGHLTTSTLDDPMLAEYDLIVIDRKEANAFSFGFGPEEGAAESGGLDVELLLSTVVRVTSLPLLILGRSLTLLISQASSTKPLAKPMSLPLPTLTPSRLLVT